MGTKSERYFFFHSFMRSLYAFIFLVSGLVESLYIVALLKTREKLRKELQHSGRHRSFLA